jgi:hypothetical protein
MKDSLLKNNDKIFSTTLNKVGMMLFDPKNIQTLDAGFPTAVLIPKFTGKYFSISCSGKRVPLIIHIVQNEKLNRVIASQNNHSFSKIDCEAYYDFTHNKYPSKEKHEQGSDAKEIKFEAKPFGKSVFGTGIKVYIGIYSRSGCHVKLGCSFGQDLFTVG